MVLHTTIRFTNQDIAPDSPDSNHFAMDPGYIQSHTSSWHSLFLHSVLRRLVRRIVLRQRQINQKDNNLLRVRYSRGIYHLHPKDGEVNSFSLFVSSCPSGDTPSPSHGYSTGLSGGYYSDWSQVPLVP